MHRKSINACPLSVSLTQLFGWMLDPSVVLPAVLLFKRLIHHTWLIGKEPWEPTRLQCLCPIRLSSYELNHFQKGMHFALFIYSLILCNNEICSLLEQGKKKFHQRDLRHSSYMQDKLILRMLMLVSVTVLDLWLCVLLSNAIYLWLPLCVFKGV